VSLDTSAQPPRYPGAHAFGDSAAQRTLFFGRDQAASDLLYQLLADRFVIVFGRSGHGKSSLLRAGLMQPLRGQGYLPFVARVSEDPSDPAAVIRDSLRREAEARGIAYEAGSSLSLWHYFKTLRLGAEDASIRPVLILDQFEELFTLVDPRARRRFVEDFADLVRGVRPRGADDEHLDVSDRAPEVKVLVSMRGDYLWEFETLPRSLPDVFRSRFRVEPLRRAEAKMAIVGPSAAPGLWASEPFEWTDEAADTVLDFLCKSPGRRDERVQVEPFLLQVVCQDIERRIIAGEIASPIVESDLRERTTFDDILTEYYTTAVGPSTALRELCERGLISRDGQRLSLGEDQIRSVYKLDVADLDRLVDTKLITRESRTGGRYYELSHDSLVEPISNSRRRTQDAYARRVKLGLAAALAAGLVYFVGTAGQRVDHHLIDDAHEVLEMDGANDPLDLSLKMLNGVADYEGLDGWMHGVHEVFGERWAVMNTAFRSPPPTNLVTASQPGVWLASSGSSASAWRLSPPYQLIGQSVAAEPFSGFPDATRLRVAQPMPGGGFALGFVGGAALLWDPENDGVSRITTHARAVRGLAVTSDGRFVATSDEGGWIRITDVSGDRARAVDSVKVADGVYHLAFHPDAPVLAVAMRTAGVQLRSLDRDMHFSSTPFSRGTEGARVNAIFFAGGGRNLFVGLESGSAWFMEIPDWPGSVPEAPTVVEDAAVMAPSQDGSRVIIVARDGRARVLDLPWGGDLETTETFRIPSVSSVEWAAVSDPGTGPISAAVATQDERGEGAIWIVSGRREGPSEWTALELARGGTTSGALAHFAGEDGAQILVASSSDGTHRVWDLDRMDAFLDAVDAESPYFALTSDPIRLKRLLTLMEDSCLGEDDRQELAGLAASDSESHLAVLGGWFRVLERTASLGRALSLRADSLSTCRG
jgi:hypothetical protein